MGADDECFDLLFQAWYLDDGALAGSHPAVLRIMHLIEDLGPALGLHVNLAKCEMFSAHDPLGHHAVTCKHGGDVHARLPDEIFDLYC